MKMKKGIALTACMMLCVSSIAYGADQPAKTGKFSFSDLFSGVKVSKYLDELDLDGDDVEVYLTVEADEEGRDGVMTVKVGGEEGEIQTFNLSEEELNSIAEPMVSYTVSNESGVEVGEYNVTFAVEDENGEIHIFNADGEEALTDLEQFLDGDVAVCFAAESDDEDGNPIVSQPVSNLKDLFKKISSKN